MAGYQGVESGWNTNALHVSKKLKDFSRKIKQLKSADDFEASFAEVDANHKSVKELMENCVVPKEERAKMSPLRNEYLELVKYLSEYVGLRREKQRLESFGESTEVVAELLEEKYKHLEDLDKDIREFYKKFKGEEREKTKNQRNIEVVVQDNNEYTERAFTSMKGQELTQNLLVGTQLVNSDPVNVNVESENQSNSGQRNKGILIISAIILLFIIIVLLTD